MALRYGYFDSEITGTDSEGMPIFDRAENSELFALLFANLVSNGVLASPADCFQVLAGDSGLTVKVRPGFGMINGRFAYDASEESLALEAAPTSYSRIDWIALRCSYVDRLCEVIVKTGAAASSPVPPDLLQPTSGDYYELGLAQVKVSANQTSISQANITDTRANSTYCGYITQLIDHLDTSVFFAQLDTFYQEFVDKSNTSYETFQNMADTAYSDFTDAINDYITALEAKGNADLTETTESLKEFQRTSQNTFNEWFESVKGKMDGDTGTKLTEITTEHTDEINFLLYEVTHNDFMAPLLDKDGNQILDTEGNCIVGSWKYQFK